MSTSSIKSTPTVIKSKPPSAGGPSPIGLSRRLDSNDDDDEYEDSSKRSSSEFDSDISENDVLSTAHSITDVNLLNSRKRWQRGCRNA